MPKYQLTLTENKLASSEMRASFMNAYTQGNGMQ